jgi:hypothetical protein
MQKVQQQVLGAEGPSRVDARQGMQETAASWQFDAAALCRGKCGHRHWWWEAHTGTGFLHYCT